MPPYWSDGDCAVHLGDCREVLAEMPEASVDSIVTDPPYEYAFMGRRWDSTGVAFDVATWEACLRVLKPGGHLLAFGAPRTWHRLAVAIEDAGFEIRDSLQWIYGSGFPKSLDVSKAIDKQRHDLEDVLGVTRFVAAARDVAGLTNTDIDRAFGFNGMAGHWTSRNTQPIVPTWDQWLQLKELLGFGSEMDAEVRRLNGRKGTPGEAWGQREVIEERTLVQGGGTSLQMSVGPRREVEANVTAPATDAARAWQGWGTALKPGWEPIILARKPLAGTVAATVLEHGTGALNIDACRVGTDSTRRTQKGSTKAWEGGAFSGDRINGSDTGRWPTNLVFTHSPECAEDGPCEPDCPVAELDRRSSDRPGGYFPGRRTVEPGSANGTMNGGWNGTTGPARCLDAGKASRFFPTFRYESKAPGSERPRLDDGTVHATVKPLALMRWLVRLVTQPGGLVLDPFAGSGTTLEACLIEGFHGVGVELDETHIKLIQTRMAKHLQPVLGFDE